MSSVYPTSYLCELFCLPPTFLQKRKDVNPSNDYIFVLFPVFLIHFYSFFCLQLFTVTFNDMNSCGYIFIPELILLLSLIIMSLMNVGNVFHQTDCYFFYCYLIRMKLDAYNLILNVHFSLLVYCWLFFMFS
uniref:SJCHGC09596 protein n=1 Tax=Schistosoma japonicum TaxID=6182 RepID=Q5DE36_SCHJA|nr:SJCHGC09596 protein [Schistosoma japonicum]